MLKCLAISSALLMAGCASVTGEKTQSIEVKTSLGGSDIAGVECSLANDEGKWSLMAPGSVSVRRSTADLIVRCVKGGLLGRQTVVSKGNRGAWGNLLLGGPAGYIVDRNTGAGFDYPAELVVEMRKAMDAGVPVDTDQKAK